MKLGALGRLSCILVLASSACGWDDEAPVPTTRPRGIQTPIEGAAAAPEAEPQAKPKARRKFDWDEYNKRQAPEAEEVKDAEEEEKKRDYSAELSSAFGSPTGCMEPRRGPEAPRRIDIQLTAVVMETGRVTRGSASSAQLNAAEIDCLTKRVRNTRLPSGVEESPRTITTTITLEPQKRDAKPKAPDGTNTATGAP